MSDSIRAKRFIRGLIDPLFKPLASYLTKGDIKYSQAVGVARELETRWRDKRAAKLLNKKTMTTGSFEGDFGARKGFGSQNHLRASQIGGASIIQSSNNASASKQSHGSHLPSAGQTNRTLIAYASCNRAH